MRPAPFLPPTVKMAITPPFPTVLSFSVQLADIAQNTHNSRPLAFQTRSLQEPNMSQTVASQDTSVLAPISNEIRRHLNYTLGHHDKDADPRYLYRAAAITVRDRLIDRWRQTHERLQASDERKVYYLSLEFLIGRSLTNAVQNLDLEEPVRAALHEYGVAMEETVQQEFCLLYTSPSPRDATLSRMPSSA